MHYVESLRATAEPTSKKVQYKIPKAEFYTSILTHSTAMFHFYTPWKCQKNSSNVNSLNTLFSLLLALSFGIEIEHWSAMG